jgi:hypothetical protein
VTALDGQVSGIFLRKGSLVRTFLRTSQSAYEAATSALQQRIKANRPSPGTDESLRRWIRTWEQQGHPDYEDMAPALAASAREQAPLTANLFQQLGTLKSLTFSRVDSMGRDIYLAAFERGQAAFSIGPLDSSGKVVSRDWEVMPY